MSKSLATGRFNWLTPAKFSLDNYDDNTLRGGVLEVDLDYPKELRELQNEHCLALDKLEIRKEMLFGYQ